MEEKSKPMYTLMEKVLKKELIRARDENRELSMKIVALEGKIKQYESK